MKELLAKGALFLWFSFRSPNSRNGLDFSLNDMVKISEV